MRRRLANALLSSTFGAVLLAGAACSSDSPEAEGLSEQAQAACDEYNRVINDWSTDYGNALASVGEAEADGNDDEKEAAVEAVRELFTSAASDLRTQAEAVSDEDLTGQLAQAADGLDEIAGEIETYDDVSRAPELMAEGTFAEGGERVNEICAQ